MLWAFWPSHANIKRESKHRLNIIFRTLNSFGRTPLSWTWLYQTPVIFHWTHFSVNYCWLSQTVSIHFSWEFQIGGFSKIIWNNWLTLCNVHFRSWANKKWCSWWHVLGQKDRKKKTGAMSMESSTQLNHEASVPPTETI